MGLSITVWILALFTIANSILPFPYFSFIPSVNCSKRNSVTLHGDMERQTIIVICSSSTFESTFDKWFDQVKWEMMGDGKMKREIASTSVHFFLPLDKNQTTNEQENLRKHGHYQIPIQCVRVQPLGDPWFWQIPDNALRVCWWYSWMIYYTRLCEVESLLSGNSSMGTDMNSSKSACLHTQWIGRSPLGYFLLAISGYAAKRWTQVSWQVILLPARCRRSKSTLFVSLTPSGYIPIRVCVMASLHSHVYVWRGE